MNPPGPIDDAAVPTLRTLSDHLRATLARIEADQWRLATPCAEWDLAALVDHVTGGNWFTCQVLAGESAADALEHTIGRFGDGNASGEAAIASVTEQLIAFAEPGVLDRTHDHVAGELTGRHILRLRLHDLIVHTWDIEHTLNPAAEVPLPLAQWGLAELDSADSITADHFAIGPSDAEPSDDASTRYLARFDRRRGTPTA